MNIIGISGKPDPDPYADYGNLPRIFAHHELVAALNNEPELMDRINHAINKANEKH